MEEAFIKAAEKFIEDNRAAILKDLKLWMAIKSVAGEAEEGAPYGPGPKKALDTALARAEEMGLRTHNCEGHMGYAELPGEQEAFLAIIPHLDVVPAEEEGWESDPFEMTFRDGYIVGRGSSDDKGAAVISLYALKFFAERGERYPYTMRLIFGTHEESGMADADYYRRHYPQPLFGFTPDVGFPVGYAEKGSFSGDLTLPFPFKTIKKLEAGKNKYRVPDRALALIEAEAADCPPEDNITITKEDQLLRIEARGKDGQVSWPAGTVNAVKVLTDYLLRHGLYAAEEEKALRVIRKYHDAIDGRQLGIALSDDIFGPLYTSGALLRSEDGRLTQSVTIRQPTGLEEERIRTALSALAAEGDGEFQTRTVRPPLVLDPERPEVRILTDSYNEVFGTNEKPYAMGGGTYARKFDNVISYGPGKRGQKEPEWIGGAHAANEAFEAEQLFKALKVYIVALARLQRHDFQEPGAACEADAEEISRTDQLKEKEDA